MPLTKTALLVVVVALEAEVALAAPARFMCDMCEDNFLHCMMTCQMEDYMTRHSYDR
jgi:hypothetical protein